MFRSHNWTVLSINKMEENLLALFFKKFHHYLWSFKMWNFSSCEFFCTCYFEKDYIEQSIEIAWMAFILSAQLLATLERRADANCSNKEFRVCDGWNEFSLWRILVCSAIGLVLFPSSLNVELTAQPLPDAKTHHTNLPYRMHSYMFRLQVHPHFGLTSTNYVYIRQRIV